MANPLYGLLNQQNRSNNNIFEQIKQFQRLFKGDAKAEVEKMLQSGRMTQQQFNELASIANQITEAMQKQ